MIHLYPIQKKAAIILSIGILSSLISFAQVCGPVMENFNTPGNGMAGFTSATQGSLSPGFTYGSTGSNGYLERCNIPAANTTYQISSRVFQTSPGQTSIGLGFELSGQVTADLVYVFLDYIDVNIGGFASRYIMAASPTYTANTATICMDIPISNIPGFVPGTSAYRFDIFIRVPSTSNNNQCITFDNFRTTGTESQATLPVTFTEVIARKATEGVEVLWNVAGEKEVSHYEVERSTDARNFTKIGEVDATGNSAYNFIDKSAGNGVTYYRVRNVDQDGKFSYSKIVKISLERTVGLTAYPQPVITDITIEHNLAANGKIVFASASGQVVKTVQVKPGVTQTTVNVSALRAGLYVIRFDNGQGEVESIKMIKQ
jgi:hypothetical protein